MSPWPFAAGPPGATHTHPPPAAPPSAGARRECKAVPVRLLRCPPASSPAPADEASPSGTKRLADREFVHATGRCLEGARTRESMWDYRPSRHAQVTDTHGATVTLGAAGFCDGRHTREACCASKACAWQAARRPQHHSTRSRSCSLSYPLRVANLKWRCMLCPLRFCILGQAVPDQEQVKKHVRISKIQLRNLRRKT